MDLKENKKEVVQSRLKQYAAKLWGYSDAETEGFDPVIDMLFGACSVEFERLSTSLYNSRSRILEKVARILLPEVNLRPVPAYAIMHAKPATPTKKANRSDQFIFEKENINAVNGKTGHKKLYFSPASEFTLVDAEVALMITSSAVMQMNEMTREIKFRSSGPPLPAYNQTIWLGLKMNPSVKNLKNVSFYFDWFNNPDKQFLLKLLPATRWFHQGTEIEVKSGYSREIENIYNEISVDIESFLDINSKTEKAVTGFFEEHFITIAGDMLPKADIHPAVFKEFYNESELEKIKEKLCWIEIRFPEIFPPDAFSSIFCTPNAFPVMNRRFHSSNRPFTISADLNILPLQNDDMFFTIHRIISGSQTSYQELPFKRASEFTPGTFTVRTKGVKRFDERDALEYVVYLLELLREEYVAFRSLNASMIEKELNDLQIIINRLQLGISKLNTDENSTHFIFMKSAVVEDIWLEYWSTAGPFANNITPGSRCTSGEYDKKSLRFLTTSTGGKNPPDQLERTWLFKNELLARNRIVTVEDIRSFCKSELGNELDKVTVEKGALLSKERSSGYMNCLHVILKFSTGKTDDEALNLVNHIEKSLERRSSCLYHYKVDYVNE
ncbi:MAG TPA: hypothetical protein VK179_00965 [Bacteroidales bacterium]|nr:hypothetical protein [Bacteroidales bacterium]